MLRLAAERDELRVVDDQFGTPTFAGFIADATAQIIEQIISSDTARRRVDDGDTVHLVNGGATHWFGFASEIFASDSVRRRVNTPRLVPIKSMSFQHERAGRPTRASYRKAAHRLKLQVRNGANRSLCA